MDEVPLIEKVQKNDINTTIIAIKKQLKELNALLGLIDIQSDKQDLSPYVRKDEVIDEVKRFDLSPVTSNAVANSLSYSTEEKKTGGYWIDGKPIYRKCGYPTGSGNLTNNTVIEVAFNWINKTVTPNINEMLSAQFISIGTSSLPTYPSCVITSVIRNAEVSNNGVAMVNIGTSSGYAPTTLFIFEYTKTTD